MKSYQISYQLRLGARKRKNNGTMSMRKLVALIISPLIPALVVSLLAIVSGHVHEVQIALLVSVCLGYPISIVFGIPLDYFVFSNPANRSLQQLLVWTGTVTALLLAILLALDSRGPFGMQLIFSPAFWIYGAVFWASFLMAAWCFLKIAYRT